MPLPIMNPAASHLITTAFLLKDQAGAWHNSTLVDLNDLEAFMNVVFEAKEWMTAHTLKR